MFHPGTQRLIDVWSALPEAGRIPARAALDPVALGVLLPQIVMAERRGEDAVLRFAGGWVEAAVGSALPGAAWLDLWAAEGRSLAALALVQTFREARPVVVVAEVGPLQSPLEITLAPLRDADGAPSRLMALVQPTTPAGRRLEAAGAWSARVAVGVGPCGRAPLALACRDGKRVA